jgi:uncharacterized protein YjbI with pentapeptide repeats
MAEITDTSLAGADLRGVDCRTRDLTNKVLFQTDLRGARLRGAHFTLDCATFDGLKLDDRQVALFLLLLMKAEIDPAWVPPLLEAVRQRLPANDLEAYQHYLQLV